MFMLQTFSYCRLKILHKTSDKFNMYSLNMRFKFIWVGKTKEKNWRALQEEYLSRLSHFVRCEIAEIKD